MKLFLCAACGRHVKERACACPFCGAVVWSSACLDGRSPVSRMSRRALIAGGATVALVTSCSSVYGAACPDQVELRSPCGFSLIETTCLGGLPTCEGDGAPFTLCSVAPMTDKCSISVVLGDGTQHTVTVTDRSCVQPSFVDFTSATCKAPAADDGGLDAADGDAG